MRRLLNEEEVISLGEAAARAGASMQEAIATFAEFFNSLAKAAAAIIQPTDETLREVATGREWHLMKNAKKYRTQKKYRNRLTKRYHEEIQT